MSVWLRSTGMPRLHVRPGDVRTRGQPSGRTAGSRCSDGTRQAGRRLRAASKSSSPAWVARTISMRSRSTDLAAPGAGAGCDGPTGRVDHKRPPRREWRAPGAACTEMHRPPPTRSAATPVYAAARGRTAHGAAVVDGNGGGPGLGVGSPRHVEPPDIADIQASLPLVLLVVLVEQFAGMAAPGAKPSAPLARVMSGSSKPIVNGLVAGARRQGRPRGHADPASPCGDGFTRWCTNCFWYSTKEKERGRSACFHSNRPPGSGSGRELFQFGYPLVESRAR